MLSAERLGELLLELRIEIAKLDMEAYMLMYLWDPEFRSYATSDNAINVFVERFVATKVKNGILYKIGTITHFQQYNGSERWYKSHAIQDPLLVKYGNGYEINGKLHRTDDPAVIYSNGEKNYYNDGNLHRTDGPAVIYPWGGVEYYVDGQCHRTDGPAIWLPDGYREYCIRGKRHRLDGPAIIYSDGDVEYWQNGVRIVNTV
jgi:hypothetical protein